MTILIYNYIVLQPFLYIRKNKLLGTFLTDSAMYSLELFNTVAMPKSPSFTSPDLVRKMFRVLISLTRKTNTVFHYHALKLNNYHDLLCP